jgi:hypothetical protein
MTFLLPRTGSSLLSLLHPSLSLRHPSLSLSLSPPPPLGGLGTPISQAATQGLEISTSSEGTYLNLFSLLFGSEFSDLVYRAPVLTLES